MPGNRRECSLPNDITDSRGQVKVDPTVGLRRLARAARVHKIKISWNGPWNLLSPNVYCLSAAQNFTPTQADSPGKTLKMGSTLKCNGFAEYPRLRSLVTRCSNVIFSADSFVVRFTRPVKLLFAQFKYLDAVCSSCARSLNWYTGG